VLNKVLNSVPPPRLRFPETGTGPGARTPGGSEAIVLKKRWFRPAITNPVH